MWGDYGRMERKVFMGVAQILLDNLDLSNMVIGWYKLFTSSSLVNHHQPVLSSGSTSSVTPGNGRRHSGSSQDSSYQSGSAGTKS